MHTKDSKGIMDTEEDKRMGVGDGGNGTRAAHHNHKKEIIILWTYHEKRKKIVWRKKSCKALQQELENKGNQGCGVWTTWNNGPECHLKTY